MENENSVEEKNVSRETNEEQQASEPTATQKVIEALTKKYEDEHALRLQAEKEANELAIAMTNFSTGKTDEKPKEETFDELSKKLFGGKK